MNEENEELVCCYSCQSAINSGEEFITHDGESVCGDCVAQCERCNDVYSNGDDFRLVDNSSWCNWCVESHAQWCDSCNEFTEEDTYYIHNICESYCESCTSNYAYWCDGCDNYNTDPCDCEDADESADGAIHDYGYRPDPIFYNTKDDEKLYFGIEIETEAYDETTSTRNDAAQYAYQLDIKDLAYLKGDGSLECGFEIVTHPMTHDFYKNEANELWEVVEGLRSRGMRSHDISRCGIHIHISRTGFNGGAHIHRFLNLVYSNQELYQKLAGRKSDRWATFEDVMALKRDGEEFTRYKTFNEKINNGRNTNRYSAINTQNRHTLEMRIFKGNLNTDTIKAHLDLAHASVEYTRTMSVSQVRSGSLSEESFREYIVANAELYPHLNARLVKLYQSAAV